MRICIEPVTSYGKVCYTDGSLQSATDFAGKTTTFAYYGPTHPAAGKISQMTNPLGKTTTYLYSDLGQVIQEAGTAGYKVTYEYDEYGSKKKMFTWRDGVTFDPTEWIYQAATGVLDSKKDAAGKSVSYTYHPTGKIHVRTWARTPLVTTTYNYQAPGDLTGIDYSDATPDVVLTGLDRLGRPTAITQTGIGTENLSFHSGKGTENARFYSTGHSLLPSIGLRTSAPDPAGCPAGFEETSGANTAVVRGVSYGYDTSGRFETISDGANSYVYSYQPNSSLGSTIESRTGGNSWFKESRYYDIPGRLVGIRSDRTNGSSVVAQISTHGYKLDALGRRTRNTFYDGSYWEYGYNDRSEVTSATRKTPAGILIPQLAASYDYDGIGNRLSSTSPILGNHTYTPNSLNQYASITTSNSRTAIGRAPAAWSVEVAGVAASRTGELYHRAITASNGVSPVWKDVVTRRDTGTPSTTGHFWYAATPLSPVHDSDGNLTNDGRWSYVWSAENRLIQMESMPQATLAGHPYTKVVNAYDWQGRRIAKHVWQGGTAASPIFSSSTRWLFNGWNEIAEFSASSSTANTLTREKTLTWGLDLSGSLQGAGGVGGLLVQTTVASGVKEGASYDGNGNIVAWTKSTASAPTARREYDAFGNTVVNEGVWPSSFGLSTKFQDTETGLYYYGYRFYDPVTGRWVSRDPFGEQGGVNLYGFVINNPIFGFDYLGLVTVTVNVDRYARTKSSIFSIVTVSSDDVEINKCCLLPKSFQGTEAGDHAVNRLGPGTFPSEFNPENGNFKTGTGLTNIEGRVARDGKSGRYPGGGHWWITLPDMPPGMDPRDYQNAIKNEFRTGDGGDNIHSGVDSRHSSGCVVLGVCPDSAQDEVSRYQNSIFADLRFKAAIACARRKVGNVSLKTIANAVPSLSQGPVIPRAIPVNPNSP